ncbi:hypothetical protein ACNHKD_06995 [Methylocystis sp. JAN1]|uniref:hypothetical protein n=1 Tax=Methylocystis sp. JAN1 TaxID=3397211 RepID=UPI003FA2EAA6
MRGVAAVSLVSRRCCGPEGARSRGGAARAFRLALLVALALAAPAFAGPRTIDDCEAIKEANAYNLCLASFGPVRGQHGATYPRMASEGEKGAAGGKSRAGVPRSATAAHGYGAAISHTSGGRVRMEFTPGRR